MQAAIITGASAGIGLCTARRFIDSGFEVVNLSRRPCPEDGVRHIPCDLGNSSFLDKVAGPLGDAVRGADRIVLVHNASRLVGDSATDTDSEQLRQVIEINLVATNTLNRFVLPMMKVGSAIVYVGSTLSEKAVPGSFSYVTTKHAQVGMMRALCQDLAGSGIHTACLCPGFTDTEMLRAHVPEEAMDAVRGMSAFGRLIEPGEIAEAVLWVAEHAVINGAVIHANLGQIES